MFIRIKKSIHHFCLMPNVEAKRKSANLSSVTQRAKDGRRTYCLFLIYLLPVLLFPGCAVNPATGQQQLMLISPSQELQIGKQYAPEVEKQLGGQINNQTLQNYINSVGQTVAMVSHMPGLTFHFIAVNDDSVNAMALPGGYIFITRGMLAQLSTEAQLAAILAHETAHITARHSAQAMSNQIGLDLILSTISNQSSSQSIVAAANIGTQLIGLKYSRSHESQADIIGTDYIVKAGYNPYAMIETMEILQAQSQQRPIEFLSTHPSPANRKTNLQTHIKTAQYPNTGKTAQQNYKQQVLNNL